MNKSIKIAIGLFLLCGLIAVTSSSFISPTSSFDPTEERDPDDPGNSPGPGFGSLPSVEGSIEFCVGDEITPNNNLGLRI